MVTVLLKLRHILSFGCRYQWVRRMSSMLVEPREVSFPVPWGHIAGKAWGDPSGKPVLAVHGWLDNAGSFDKLIPLLSKDLYVVAVDWPGHGKSSHRPIGTQYNVFDYVADIKYIMNGLKWERFTLLAHSMGGGAASWFAGALPEHVECLVLLESFGFWSEELEDIPKKMGRALKNLTVFQEVENKPYPTWDSVLDRMCKGHMDKLFDRECARILAQRGTRQLENGSYQFTRDLRVKSLSILKIAHEVNLTFLKAIDCPTLIIGADSGQLMDILKGRFSDIKHDNMKLVEVPGGHHVHLYNPEVLCSLVNSFILHQTIPPDFKEIVNSNL